MLLLLDLVHAGMHLLLLLLFLMMVGQFLLDGLVDRVVELDAMVYHNFFLFAIRHGDSLFAKARGDPQKANGVEFFFAFVGQLRLFAPQFERVLTPLLHDPSTKRFVGWVALWYVAILMNVLVFDELLVSLFPSHSRFGHTPLKAWAEKCRRLSLLSIRYHYI